MRYRKLDAEYDFTFGHGRGDYLQDIPEAPGQAVLTRLRLFTNEWFLNLLEGTPYRTRILGKYGMQTWARAIRRRIRGTQGVLSLDVFTYDFDENARRAVFNAEITTIYGKILLDRVAINTLPLYGQ